MTFSIVVPVYRNEASLPELLKVLEEVQRALDCPIELVFVVDGSPDCSYSLLAERLRTVRFSSQLLLLSRNFGSFSAIRAGLAVARGEQIAVLAADLQEPPELVLKFREEMRASDVDLVVGRRVGREDPITSRIFARLYWSLYRRLVQRGMPAGGVDVFACTAEFRDRLLELHERNSSLVGLAIWLGFRRSEVDYVRRARTHGKSAWTVAKKLRYLRDSAFAFSDLPLRLLSWIGLIGVGCSVGLGFVVLVAKLLGTIPVPGYTATALMVMFFGGLNSLGLGILGEYLWRTFENTKGRPDSVVMARREFGGTTDHV